LFHPFIITLRAVICSQNIKIGDAFELLEVTLC
jgi:hypothetical protein